MIEHEAAARSPVGLGAHDLVRALEDNVARVIYGKREVVRFAVVSLLARGHVLIEDVPGVGKTMLAQALARSLGLTFQRVQFTSDLLPSDIIGVSVYDQESSQFRFTQGPLFAHVVLADEINRATPKTQSALLEAMSEGWVSVDRERYSLPDPFLVLATQNPLEHEGTFPLPESQLDRFLMSLEVGYPEREHERDLLMSGGVADVLENLPAVLDQHLLRELQQRVSHVRVAEKLTNYMLDIAGATRSTSSLALGVSPRGVQGLYRAAQALAFCEGRDFAIPDDVQKLVPSVLGHRVVVRHGREESNSGEVLRRLVRRILVPI